VPLACPPETRVVYSDVGFLLLGLVVPAITGAPLDVSVGELVIGPLGMTRTGFRPQAEQAEQAGQGEHVGVAGHQAEQGEKAAATELQPDGTALAGIVHDENLRREACRTQTAGLDGARGLGWALRGDPADSLGTRWPPGSVSHTGFTGTSIACDPASGGWAVLLTNEVHFGRGRGVIRQLREAVHDCCAPAPR
jgi:CubicO group peptidase (beta-lactamase class C family)